MTAAGGASVRPRGWLPPCDFRWFHEQLAELCSKGLSRTIEIPGINRTISRCNLTKFPVGFLLKRERADTTVGSNREND